MDDGKRGRDFAKGVIVFIFLFMVAAFVIIIIYPRQSSIELACRAMCMTNLNSIGKSVLLYEGMHEALPSDFDKLVAGGFASRKMFVCPGSMVRLNERENYSNPDYVLAISGNGLSSMRASAILAFELPINHMQGQVNYVAYSGSVANVKQPKMDDFITALQDTNNMIAEKRNSPEER